MHFASSCRSYSFLRTYRKYRQLKLSMETLREQYDGVLLQFKWNQAEIRGVLNGSVTDWNFRSQSPAFIRLVPSGHLSKYSLWVTRVPKSISKLYNGIADAALKAGYDMNDKEELV